MKGLAARFLIPIGAFSAAFAAFVLYRTHASARDHVGEVLKVQAALALEFDLAIRSYVGETIRPAFEARVGPDEFIRDVMSTSFVARRIFETVRERFPNYLIKFSAEDPRNPANLAGPEERGIIEYFRRNPDADRWVGEIRIGGVEYMAHFSPRRLKEECLRCHGRPEDAPVSLIEQYGATHGFDRKIGDVVALDTIAIPTSPARSALLADVARQAGVAVVGLMALFGTIAIHFRNVVTRRLTSLASHFRQSAEQAESCPPTPVAIEGRDEVGELAVHFNALAGRLRETYETLEQRVRERTAELASANDKLERACAAAETASRAKSAFLANMSHEIRTPMNGIIGLTNVVLESELTSEQREHLAVVKNSASSLLRILNDILEFSRIEAGRIAFNRREFPLRKSLRDNLAPFAIAAQRKEVEFRVDIDPDVPDSLVGDPDRLAQVIGNIVGNAVKFTDRGRIAVRVHTEAHDGDEAILRFAVSDTGIGIPACKRREIFEAFVQVDGSFCRSHGGTGLGLSIASLLIEQMGGRIDVESELRAGSTFTFTARFGLPGAPAATLEATASTSP